MAIRRGRWVPEKQVAASRGPGKYGARPGPVREDGMSNSEAHMKERNIQKQGVSGPALNQVSEERQGDLIRGTMVQDGDSGTAAPKIAYSTSYKKNREMQEAIQKTASTAGIGSGTNSVFSVSGGGDTVRQAPEVYSPLFQIANLQLPRDRITMNAWNRNFYDTHPLVRNCINLHATYPINKINIKCGNKQVEDFFNNMIEEIDLTGILQEVATEFWKHGEVFPYANLDPSTGRWSGINILNPDYVHVKKAVVGDARVLSMRADAATQALVTSNNPADIQLRKQLDPEVIHRVKKGQNIPLDNFHVSHLKMASSPYDIRGTSPIVSVYKDLMLYDKLREAKFAQAGNLVNPITLVKVGGTGEGEYHPTENDLENWRQTMEAAQYDRDFKIISHAGVDIQRVGASGAIIDIANDMNFIMDNIMYGLMVPKAVLTQEGSSYNSATVGLEVLKTRYETFRNMIARWLVNRIFAPISEIQGFYEYKDGVKKLIVPDVEWNQMILFDLDNYINVLKELTKPGQQGEPPAVSRETLFKSLGLDPEKEQRRVRHEMVQDIIAQKERVAAQDMSLSELRSIKEGEDIVEKADQEPLPGAPGAQEGMPGAGGGGLGLGPEPLGGGGLGPMPAGPGGGEALPGLPAEGPGGGAGPEPAGGGGAPEGGGGETI